MNNYMAVALGLTAQGLFAGRFVVQLLQSEKSNRVESPTLFWQLSLFASFLLLIYGVLRNDIVIAGGQLIGFLIYIRNLQLKGNWEKIPEFVRILTFFLPSVLLWFMVFGSNFDWEKFIANPEIDSLLLTWGTFGQVLFTSRFVVQWLYSEKLNESLFPVTFWYISIIGSVMIAVYAIFRKDAVLFIGQAFGLLVYGRNLFIHHMPLLNNPTTLLSKFTKYRLSMLLVFMGMILFFNLGNWGVTESSEARYAQISKEMLESGDYFHPTLMGIYHYHKPPLTYWITALSYKLFGISSWSARFFLQIAILMQIWLVYKIGKLLYNNRQVATYAAFIYSSFFILIISGRALTTDAYLSLSTLAAMYAWFLYLKNDRQSHLLVFYLMLGLGFFIKGPVILVVPLAVILFQKYVQKVPLGSFISHLPGMLIFLFTGLGWFVYLYTENPEFLDYFFFNHTVQRFSTNNFSRSQPFWFYGVLVISSSFPWLLVLLSKIKSLWRNKADSTLMLLAWIFIPLVFFSISQSKLVLYILPIYPAIALSAAWVWQHLPIRSQLFWDRVQLGFHLLVILALAFIPIFEPQIVLSYKFYFILIISTSVLVSIQFIAMKSAERTVFAAVFFLAGITASSTYFMGNNAKLINDQQNIAAFIQQQLTEKENILVYDKRLPSIEFLTTKNIISLYDGSEDLNRETQFEEDENWRKNLINLKENKYWLNRVNPSKSVLMIKKNKMPTDQLKWDEKVFSNQIEIDGWILLY
ncbi:lipid-A-disaccharide synthase N-terminal domain-containing protein [Cyclobacterium plantarum]|uniref:lipid-A-disaccharide synthase N-terminal domain-containing protein n=1 Tax=Cyclobacterium plantarum TaxID=2716263 RepID=UPI003F726AAB